MANRNAAEEEDGRPSGMTSFESRLVNLLGLLVVQERHQPEQISLPSRAGFRPAEIAGLLGTTRNTVSVELSNQRRARRAGKPKKGRNPSTK